MTSGSRNVTPDVAERLGHYVYALRDPQTAEVFYIGKGRGARVFSHVTESERRPEVEAAKNMRIRDIESSGRKVQHLIVRFGLETHEDGLLVEQAVIDGLTAAGVTLTNIQGGHDSGTFGLSTVDAAIARLSAPTAPATSEAIVMFIINKAWYSTMSDEDVYRVTRGHWRVGPDTRARATYAFGVAHGVVRGVYRCDNWFRSPLPGEENRWGFEGHSADEMAAIYLGTSVRHLVPENGAQNPVRRHLDGFS